MPVVSEARRSHAIRQFAPALEALEAEGIIARAAWDAMKGTGRPKLILSRGPRLAPREPAAGMRPPEARRRRPIPICNRGSSPNSTGCWARTSGLCGRTRRWPAT